MEASVNSQAERARILVIDDAPVNLQVLTAALAADFNVQIATSGAMGLALAAKSLPDLILLDIMMPQMDGFEVCRRLKADPALQAIPVIFITARSDIDAETDGLTLGAVDYITKPIKVQIVKLRIRNLIDREILRKQIEAQHRELELVARFDTLTRLPNRAMLADRMNQALLRAQRQRKPLAVAFLDLDGFKAVNDTHGHDAGDHLLITLAERMRQTLRDGDTLARLGGDEFVAVLPDLADYTNSAPILNRLLAAAAQPVWFGEASLQVSASLGVSFYPQAQEIDADQLLRQADQAMYQAKLAGKNRFAVFDADQDRSLRAHHASMEGIRQALLNKEFVLHYQPKVNLRSGQVTGAEALIRWVHPQRGILPPGQFLPMIEDHPIAIELGQWVIDSVLHQLEAWNDFGFETSVSINIGARHLQQADFVARLRQSLAAHPRIKPSQLELELMETSTQGDWEHVSGVLDGCRQLGIKFALDDFGTGFSSLTYLKRLPVSQLKIDRSFLKDMLANPGDLAILKSIIDLASAFDIEVLAEGVETVEHGVLLLQFGCELAQGYGIARPMPPSELPGWVSGWKPDPAWTRAQALQAQDVPILFAGVEHRVWLIRLQAFIKGEQSASPPIDHGQCRFGKWLQNCTAEQHAAHPTIRDIDSTHRQVHAMAAQLLELHAAGQNRQALAGMAELDALRDVLLGQLKSLL